MTLSPYRGINPVDHERGSIAGSEVNISSDEVSNLCDRPVMDLETKWDNEVPLEPSDPGYSAYVYHLVSQALRRDEDALVDDEYPEIVKYIVKNVWMSGRAWYEHDIRLEEQQTVCTTPGCQCERRFDSMFRKLEYGMETDDSELEDIVDWNKRSYGMSNTNNYSEGMAPRTYTPPPPLRKKRGRKYASLRKYETDIEDYFSDTSEEESWTDRMQRPIESVMYNDNVDTSTLSDGKDTISQSELTGLTECGVYSSTTEVKGLVDRPVNKSVTAWNGHWLDYDPFIHGLLD